MADLKLYSATVCPFAQRTRIALLLKGITHDTVEIDLTKDSEPWFLKLNPEGTVPTIVHQGRALYESNAINEYLDEVFPGPRLLPADPWMRGVSRILMDFCNRNLNPPFYALLMNQDRARDAELKEQVRGVCRYLNERLMSWNAQGTYVWDEFGMADLTFAPFFKRMILLKHYRGLEVPGSAELPRFRRWYDALVAHPAVVQTSLSDGEYIKGYEAYARGEV